MLTEAATFVEDQFEWAQRFEALEPVFALVTSDVTQWTVIGLLGLGLAFTELPTGAQQYVFKKIGAKRQMPREELAKKCDKMSTEIIDFLFERKMGEPDFFPETRENLSDQAYKRFRDRAEYSGTTRNTYTRRFHAQLYDLYALLKRNGHNPDDGPLFGEDSWADRIASNLTIYASIIREGGTVDDKKK